MSDRSIREAIQYLAGNNKTDTVYAIDAIVNSVDKAARTCECEMVTGSASNIIPDVRLMASVDDGILILPAIGSNVTIILSTFTDPYVSSYSEVKEIIFRGGDLGGLVKIMAALKSFNQLENDINTLKQAFQEWVVAANDGGAALKAVAATWYGESLTVTKQSDIENTLISQG